MDSAASIADSQYCKCRSIWILTHPDPQVHTFRIRIGPVQSNPQGVAQAVTHAMGSRVRMQISAWVHLASAPSVNPALLALRDVHGCFGAAPKYSLTRDKSSLMARRETARAAGLFQHLQQNIQMHAEQEKSRNQLHTIDASV